MFQIKWCELSERVRAVRFGLSDCGFSLREEETVAHFSGH
jgi:hypothetical protein